MSKQFKKFRDLLSKSYKPLLQKFAERETSILRKKIVERTPVDRSDLREGFKAAPPVFEDDKIIIRVTNAVEYAPHVEYGHRQDVGRYLLMKFSEGKYRFAADITEYMEAKKAEAEQKKAQKKAQKKKMRIKIKRKKVKSLYKKRRKKNIVIKTKRRFIPGVFMCREGVKETVEGQNERFQKVMTEFFEEIQEVLRR